MQISVGTKQIDAILINHRCATRAVVWSDCTDVMGRKGLSPAWVAGRSVEAFNNSLVCMALEQNAGIAYDGDSGIATADIVLPNGLGSAARPRFRQGLVSCHAVTLRPQNLWPIARQGRTCQQDR